jgi:hypothetical protein
LRQYGLIVAGLLILAGGIVLFAASPEEAPGNSAITISQGASRSLSPDFLGFNGDSSSAAWSNPALLPAISALGPETIRGMYGGTPSNYFNWQTGQAFVASNDPGISYIKPGWPNPPYALTNYVNALKASGADAIFNINIMTYCPVNNADPQSTSQAGASCTQAQACGPNPSQYTTSCTDTDETWGLDYQVAMLKAAQSMGVPIKYIELGNEVYNTNNADYVYYFPSVQDYINKANAWIPVLKADFPGAQIAVVGEGSCQPLTTAAAAWNQAIASGVHGEGGITFHEYYANDIPDGESVSNAADLAALLSAPTQNCSGVLQHITSTYLPSGVSAWVTEWDLWSGNTGIVLGSWAHGLMAATYALDLARDPQVELTAKHDLFSNQVYGSLFDSTNGYVTTAEGGKTIGTPSPLPTTQAFAMTASGFTLSALERSLHGATSTTPLTLSSNPDIAGTSVPGLMGQSFTVGGKTNLYFVNLSADSEVINLGSLSGNYSVVQYASDPANFITGNSSIPASLLTATNSLTIPAYSVTSLVGGAAVPVSSSGSQSSTTTSTAPKASTGSSSSASSATKGSAATATTPSQANANSSSQQNAVTLDLGGQHITIHSGLLKSVVARYKTNKWLPITIVVVVIVAAVVAYELRVPRILMRAIKRLMVRIGLGGSQPPTLEAGDEAGGILSADTQNGNPEQNEQGGGVGVGGEAGVETAEALPDTPEDQGENSANSDGDQT